MHGACGVHGGRGVDGGCGVDRGGFGVHGVCGVHGGHGVDRGGCRVHGGMWDTEAVVTEAVGSRRLCRGLMRPVCFGPC